MSYKIPDGQISMKGIEEILLQVIAHNVTDNKPTVLTENIHNLFWWAKKQGMKSKDFFKGINDSEIEKALKPQNFISNNLSIGIYDNVDRYFGEGPEIFRQAAFDSRSRKIAMNWYLKLFMIPEHYIQHVADYSAKVGNKNKLFRPRIEDLLNGLKKFTIDIFPLPGLTQPPSIVQWTAGNFDYFLHMTAKEVPETPTMKYDEQLGTYQYQGTFKTKTPLPHIGRINIEKTKESTAIFILEKEKLLAERKRETEQISSTISAGIKARHPNTVYHMAETMFYSLIFGKQLELTNSQLETLCKGALLHDIGKVTIPEHILHKKTDFSEEEYEIMKLHTVFGELILLNNYPLDVARCCSEHQESPNGTGYPMKLSEENTSIEGLILQIVDPYSALRTERIYKQAMPHEKIIEIFKKDIKNRRIQPLLGQIYIEHTIPFIQYLEKTRPKLFNFHQYDESKTPPNFSQLEKELIGLAKGNIKSISNLYIPPKSYETSQLINRKIPTDPIHIRKQKLAQNILEAYAKISSAVLKEHIRRTSSPYFENDIFPDDGIRGI